MTVPDDASVLDADRTAWLAEERSRRRRARWRRLVLTRRWERFGLSGPIVFLCLLVTAGVGALAVVFVPRPPSPPPAAQPLADAPRVAVPAADAAAPSAVPAVERAGAILGRRLPAADLAGDVRTVATDRLRPAMVLLVPAGCRCTEAVGALYRQAREFRLPVWLVTAGEPDPARATAARRGLATLDEDAAAGGARWAVDPDAVLLRALAARGLTVVLVRPDGVVTDLLRDVGSRARDVPAMEILIAGLVPRR